MNLTDKELADRVVALGVGNRYERPSGTIYEMPFGYTASVQGADGFVRDWRVAGALMEKLPDGLLTWQQHYPDLAGMKVQPVWVVEPAVNNADGRDESLPRAITEACVEALT